MLFKRKSKVEKLSTKSKEIVGVFTKTITDLHEANSLVAEHRSKQLAEKEKLEAELRDLEALEASNTSVIENISKIFPH